MRTFRLFVVLLVTSVIVTAVTPVSAQVCTYTVQQGDTLTSVASQFDTEEQYLKLWNRLGPEVTFTTGTSLWVCQDFVQVIGLPSAGETTLIPTMQGVVVGFAQQVQTPQPTVTPESETITGVIVSGVPEIAENYEMADLVTSVEQYVEGGPFVGTLTSSMRTVISFPGVSLTHDTPVNQYQDRFSPLTQIPLQGVSMNVGCGEGRFLHFVLGHGNITFENGMSVSLQQHDYTNYWVVVRCPYTDGLQNSDRGVDALLSDYESGYGHVMVLPAGGYYDEPSFLLGLPLSHHGYTAGSEGATNLVVVTLDLNTGVTGTNLHTEDEGWQEIDSNLSSAG